jgi:hypothetical protein
MTIKRILMVLIIILGAALMLVQAQLLQQSYEKSIMSSKNQLGSIIASDLLEAASLLALERGLTNATLGNPEPANTEILKK